jgi:hypothetical protein
LAASTGTLRLSTGLVGVAGWAVFEAPQPIFC